MIKVLNWKIGATLAAALLLGFFNLPSNIQTKIAPFTPEFITETKVQLGLDLQGGSQLDYKIDLRKVPEADRENIIEGVKEVIEKRVNALGVAEPNIYISDIADEKHIIVELAESANISDEDVQTYLGVTKAAVELSDDEKKLVSLEKAKATVGKTIQLEFKEEKETLDPADKEKIVAKAEATLNGLKNGANFSVMGQEEMQANPGRVIYEKKDFQFAGEISEKIKAALASLKAGEMTQSLIETGGNFTIDASGQAKEETSLSVIKLIDSREEIKTEKEVSVSHILIAYKDAEKADVGITRSKDEAEKLAQTVKDKLAEGKTFTDLAKEYSNDTSNKDQGGKLTTPVSEATSGTYVPEFEEAALELSKAYEVSEPIETPFGFHLIKADEIKTDVKETQYKYEIISYSTTPDAWQDTGLTGAQFVRADVEFNQMYQPYIKIQFNEEGGKLFEELTEKNINKRIGIFVGGELVSDPNVSEKIAGGQATIVGQFTVDEAKGIARDLNTGAIPAPIVLAGEYTIGATLGHEALTKSLQAGGIGLVLVMAFMLAFYRIAGAIANVALALYSLILIFLIKAHLHLGLALAIALGVFAFLIVKTVNNHDSGMEKMLSFILSCLAFFFLTFLLKTGVVLTLAGIAGIILSVGMAVDANILIFERFKEELRDGKPFSEAAEEGFARAWSAIRDSNFSTLITCAILFYFGSSIVKGFAFNLAAGILVSMFTAITITKTLLTGFVGTRISKNLKAFGLDPHAAKQTNFQFMKYAKNWLLGSGAAMVIGLIAIGTFGLNLGIDFKGGTLLEFQFQEKVTKEQLQEAFTATEKELTVKATPATEEPKEETKSPDATLVQAEETKLDLTNSIQVIESGDNKFIIKTEYLTSETHDKIITAIEGKLPKFTELRFTTIGPVAGATLLNKAMVAIAVAIAMIIIYVAFAFRKLPKEVSPWKFGVCAIAALVHDIIITTGIFAILGQFLNVEINALFITAMLTVFGYSVNDTIIVFDRLRDNLLHNDKHKPLAEVTDDALNQTLRRSTFTSFTTMLALIAVLIFGSESIFYFVLALTLGIGIGTYSSIFAATPLLVLWTEATNKKK